MNRIKSKWLVPSVALGLLSFAYTQALVMNVKADGCYRSTMIICGTSTTCGCPATIDLNPYGISTAGELSTVWYHWVTTAGAPSAGWEDYTVTPGANMICQYLYWDNSTQTYQTVNLPISSTVHDWRDPNTSSNPCNF